jgi:hypothetical protein
MIIYVSNLTTYRNSITIPFEPTEEISNKVCELRLEQYYVNTAYPIEIQCSLTQPYSAAFNYSTTQNGTNVVIGKQTDSASNMNGSWACAPRYVKVDSGPQDLKFSILRYVNGAEDQSTVLFCFLVRITPAPDRIPATLFAKSNSFPLKVLYDPPFHLAGKEVWLHVDHSSTFSPILNRRFTLLALTQIHSNDNKIVHVRENRNLYRDIPIKVYMPHGPFELILDSLDEPTTVPLGTLTSNTATTNSWTWTYASSTAADTNAYKAFGANATTTWTSAASYTASTGVYTGTTTTGTVAGEYVEVILPWTGFNVDSMSFTGATVGSYKLMRQITTTGNWEEVVLGRSGRGTNNETKYRLVFTSSAGATAVTISNVVLRGTYNAMPQVLFTFTE